MSEPVFLYFVTSARLPRLVKVGIAADVDARIKQLQTAHPYSLRLKFSMELPSREFALRIEREIHSVLAEWRECGEWFNCGAYVALEFTEDVMLAMPGGRDLFRPLARIVAERTQQIYEEMDRQLNRLKVGA